MPVRAWVRRKAVAPPHTQHPALALVLLTKPLTVCSAHTAHLLKARRGGHLDTQVPAWQLSETLSPSKAEKDREYDLVVVLAWHVWGPGSSSTAKPNKKPD